MIILVAFISLLKESKLKGKGKGKEKKEKRGDKIKIDIIYTIGKE